MKKKKEIVDNSFIGIISSNLSVLLFSVLIFVLVLFFLNKQNYNTVLLFLLLYWLFSIVCFIKNKKKNYLLIFFFFSIFVFILSRPTISMIRGDEWWYFDKGAIFKALISIFLSMVFLLIGNKLSYLFEFKKHKSKEKNEVIKEAVKKISLVILIGIFITFIFNIYIEINNYFHLRNLDYSYVYTGAAPSYNIVFNIMSSLYIYLTLLYLAMLPQKKQTYLVLFLLIIASIPSFLLGSRNVLVLRILLVLVYIILRNIINKDEKWINKKMTVSVIIFIPVFFVFMGAYNYIRDSKSFSMLPINLIEDTFYKQGTTFDTICEGFVHEDKLKDMRNISYTIGDIADYLLHNKISNKLFKTAVFPNGNSMIVVNKGNSMAHKLSYLELGEKSYLSGHGRGTSYIIETYMDGSYFLLEIYSSIIGFFLSSFVDLFDKKNIYIKYILLLIIFEIFLLPRYSASGFISFIFKPYFLFTVVLFFILSNFFIKKEKTHEKGK